ncbi:uncharacterized protein [Glycine max]|uniref:uncharacterized protein isoform X2 n=1 Tax=Glycine max TaxID=3847 RepID=UPI001B35587C|nr:uncharacterized protein LOC100780523 isoform X2 [Glycine max]
MLLGKEATPLCTEVFCTMLPLWLSRIFSTTKWIFIQNRKIKKLKSARERGLKLIALARIIVGAPNQTGLLPSSVHAPPYALKSSVVSAISAASLSICHTKWPTEFKFLPTIQPSLL